MPQRDSLAQENTVLKTNISSLFRTAQLEMQRKQAEIAELRRRWVPRVTLTLHQPVYCE